MTKDIEGRVRALIARIGEMPSPPPGTWPDPAVDLGFEWGLSEAYDNVLDWLYADVLGEQR
jgi:hypothetical protein